jgi:hypothetical protein
MWREKEVLTMNLNIEIPDEFAPALKAKAEAHGVSPDRFASSILQSTLAAGADPQNAGEPFETGYGMWAKYGPAPSAEEIDENRREMFRNFAQDI